MPLSPAVFAVRGGMRHQEVPNLEIWDLYDESRQPLDQTHRRGEPMKPGEYHIVVEVWTVNSDGEVLVTLRDSKKEDYPDKWENTGGSVLSGERSRQGAVRELFEKTGILAAEDELIPLGSYKEAFAFVDIYLLKRDIPIDRLTMQAGETVEAKWITIQTLDSMIADASLALPTGQRLRHVRREFDRYLHTL